MTDVLSPEQRRVCMAAVKGKNTSPELLVRSVVHRLGFRYTLHDPNLPGKPDLVFPSRRKVIFVHGCFWHQHGCILSDLPKSNKSYWGPKLERNRQRDVEHLRTLRANGWKCLVVWECQLGRSKWLVRRLENFLG